MYKLQDFNVKNLLTQGYGMYLGLLIRTKEVA